VGPQLGVGPNLKVGPQLGVGPNVTTGPRLGVGPSNIPYQGQMGNHSNNQNNFQRNSVGSYPNQNMAKAPIGIQQVGTTNNPDPKNVKQNLPKEEAKNQEPEKPREIYKTMYPDSEIVKYEGEMKLGKRHGYGKSNYRSGRLMYEGMFVNDMPDDNGKTVTLYYENENVMYEGKCSLGVKVGFGKIFWDNGQLQYSGNWYNNMPDGEDCKVYGKDGSIIFEGRLVNGIYKFAGMVKYQYGAPI